MPPRGEPIYAPWPMFEWLATPLYKQSHQSANQDGLFYCGRTIWPDDLWWSSNHNALGLEHTYWVIKPTRKSSFCGTCKTSAAAHLDRRYEPNRGWWALPERHAQVVSFDGLVRVARMMYE